MIGMAFSVTATAGDPTAIRPASTNDTPQQMVSPYVTRGSRRAAGVLPHHLDGKAARSLAASNRCTWRAATCSFSWPVRLRVGEVVMSLTGAYFVFA